VNRFKNISKYQQKIKRAGKVSTMRKTDCVIVVNMMLTGFDAKKVNTLYVDRRTKQHGLIQAFSRTNQIWERKESPFCPLETSKKNDGITLFSNKEAKSLPCPIMKR
jgi:type I restriction enzyme R subunit